MLDIPILPNYIDLTSDIDQVLKLNDDVLMHGPELVLRRKAKVYKIESEDLDVIVERIPLLDPSRSTLLHALSTCNKPTDIKSSVELLIQSNASVDLFIHTALSLISSYQIGVKELRDILMYLAAGYSMISSFDDSIIRDAFLQAVGGKVETSDGWDIEELPEMEDEGMSGIEKCDAVFGVLERVGSSRNSLMDYR
jgi:hypothetical protein